MGVRPTQLTENRKNRLAKLFRVLICQMCRSDTHALDIRSKDEIGSLSGAFNSMARSVDERTSRLQKEVFERKQAEERLRKLTRAVEDNPMAIIITDREGTIEYVNPKFTDITAYESDEVIGRNPNILKSDEHSKEFFEEMWETILAGKEWHGEFLNKRKTGELRWQSAIIAPIFDENEEITHFVSIQEDVTEKKEAAGELQKLSRAIEHSPVSVVITNREGTIEYVNPAFCEVTGYTQEEAIGQNPRVLSSGQQSPEFYQDMWETISSGRAWQGEFANRKKTGEIYWENASISPVLDEQGEVTHYVAVKEDITERKEMEQALRLEEVRLKNALEGANAGLWDYSATTGEFFTGDIWSTMLGYTPEELDEKYGHCFERWSELVHPDDLPGALDTVEKYTNGETDTYKSEFRMRTADGRWKWILDVGKATERDTAGRGTRFVGVQLDIDDTKRLQEEILVAKEKAEEATKAKSDFLANMSHEIRTPMNAIIGMSHLALKTDLTPKQQDYIGKVQSSSNALLGIISDILDFSKIEAGKLDMESIPFHLEDVFDNLANLVGLKAKEKGLKFLFDVHNEVPTGLIGDPLRLGQILVNLGNNAVKFTEKGQIVVGVSPVAVTDEKAELQFSVQDSGIGLTEEQRGKLFQAFSQADTSTTRKYGGTGLGLTISKKLTEMMDGKIWVESEPGVGSTFIFTAVFGRHSEKREEVSTSKGDVQGLENIRGARILLAEDNEINQQVAQEILEQASLVVEIANNGVEAVEMAQKNPYDIILMDIQMPEMNGFEATREIRNWEEEEQFRNPQSAIRIPIVAMTAHAMAGDRQKSIEGGMNDHVTKPIDPDQLFSALVKWIEPGEREVPEAFEAKVKEKSEDEILPKELPGISIKSGLKKVGGNKKLYRKLLGKFLDSNKEVVNEIKTTLAAGDTETAARLAHTVKGVSGNLGAEELFPVAGELEKAIKQGETDSLDSLLDSFESHLNMVLGGIEVLKEQEAAKKKEEAPAGEIPIDIDTVTPLLTEMAELLESDLGEAMSRLESLKPHLENSLVGEEFRRFEKSLENFDTDDAVGGLQKIAERLNISLKEDG